MRSPLLAAIISGILLGIAYQFVGVLGFIALVPLLSLIGGNASNMRRWSSVGLIYVTMLIYHASTNWWICSWQERTDPYLFASGLALIFIHPLFLALPYCVLASVRRRLGLSWMLWLAPLAITGFEWLHGQTDASYPWLTSGYQLTQTPWGQLAEFGGVYGLTLLLASVNALLTYWLMLGRGRRQSWIIPVSTVAVLSALLVVGLVRQHEFVGEHLYGADGSKLRAVVVQPNEDPWDKWNDVRVQVAILRHVTDSACLDLENAVVFWPETAIPYAIRQPVYGQDWEELQAWVDSSGNSLITGYADWYQYPPGTAPPSARSSRTDPSYRYDTFNAAMLLMPRRIGGMQDHSIPVHRKTMLTPLAERLPFADQLSFAMSWIEWGVGISAWGKGSQREPLPYGSNARIGMIICIESIYPEVSRDLVNHGANVLSVITNDAWYNGTWGPDQHFNIARMRAIEMRRPVVRCANSGVSGFIEPDGSAPARLPVTKRTALVANVSGNSYRTVYAVAGDVVPPLGLAISIVLLVAARFPSLVRKLSAHSEQNPSATP